jgi:hypothetical protein
MRSILDADEVPSRRRQRGKDRFNRNDAKEVEPLVPKRLTVDRA